ncbi:MAG: hypothetical protein ICV79_24940 [Flavisolibacter sp.]|nr:hypothetical protein [Flavisolibacter sp.]
MIMYDKNLAVHPNIGLEQTKQSGVSAIKKGAIRFINRKTGLPLPVIHLKSILMNTKHQIIINKELYNEERAMRLLLKKINANVKVDKELKKQVLRGMGYVSWPQGRS